MFPDSRYPLEPSLWYATAAPPPATHALAESLTADVVIIGAGYAGLSTAIHLAELGYKPVVLEAREIGFGGSGRSGGQLVAGLKWDPEELLAKYPGQAGEKLVRFAGSTTAKVLEIIDRYAMQVPLARNGWIQPAHNSQGLKLAARRVAQWANQGADVSLLSRAQVAELTGTQSYLGGWLDKRGGAVQPLSYVRELGRVAQSLGAQIYTDTPVQAISHAGQGWELSTVGGPVVKAASVIVCANAYSDGLWPNLKQSIIDANTYQVATQVLPADVAASIFPQGHVASDTRNLLFYFRKDHTGRFIMGGRGPFREPRGRQDWAHLQRAAVKMFPALASVSWEYYWCGRVAVTPDFLPHLHEPAPGLLLDIGCQGRGIGLQTSMGEAFANYIHSRDPNALPLPVSRIAPIPLYALRKLYVSAVVSWYQLQDGGA